MLKPTLKSVVVIHACNPSTQEEDQEFEVSFSSIASSRLVCGLREIPSQETKTTKPIPG